VTSSPETVDPATDEAKLRRQGQERPSSLGDGTIGVRTTEVYSEDWWAHTRPTFEIHGYFRTRGEMYHNFALGRPSVASGLGRDEQNLWPQPIDNSFTLLNGQPRQVLLCGSPAPNGTLGECSGNKTESTANLRLRLNPEIHISDNLRILSQVDFLDNLVLGSTPDSYALRPGGTSASGFSPAGNGYNAYAPLSSLSTTQTPPTAGVNALRNSIDVQRAWAEYVTPLGQVRFGRMPHHWGLGMLVNSGDGIDHDYQSNIDRIMVVSGVRSMDLFVGGSWDFVASGPTSASPYDIAGGQPRNVANQTNVDQWSAFIAKRTNPEITRLKLARNEVVVNAGLYTMYRRQLLDVRAGSTPYTLDAAAAAGTPAANNGLERRGAEMLTPDLWFQVLWNKLRVEAEVATIWGSIENSPARAQVNDPIKLRMWGLATQTEYRAVEDKLRIQFGAGWSSGDPNVEGLNPGPDGLQVRKSEGPISTFRFHPSYQVDYILFRRLLTRVEGAYYFRPSFEYDFIRKPSGQKLGATAAAIWSRASEFIQTPGNKRDLGIELNFQVYYQAKDGMLNDDPSKLGGLFAALQYGVLFPLGGLNFLPGESTGSNRRDGVNYDVGAAQTLRLVLGVLF